MIKISESFSGRWIVTNVGVKEILPGTLRASPTRFQFNSFPKLLSSPTNPNLCYLCRSRIQFVLKSSRISRNLEDSLYELKVKI